VEVGQTYCTGEVPEQRRAIGGGGDEGKGSGTRHSVQRLWPETLVDMAAGGLTTQVIVKPSATDALCLLRALDIPPGELEWAERLALETGLSVQRIRSQPVTEITKGDVDAAGPTHR